MFTLPMIVFYVFFFPGNFQARGGGGGGRRNKFYFSFMHSNISIQIQTKLDWKFSVYNNFDTELNEHRYIFWIIM